MKKRQRKSGAKGRPKTPYPPRSWNSHVCCDVATERKEVMKDKKEIISTQIRLPTGIHEYIRQEADRMGIAQNTFLIILLEQGKKLWEADVTHLREVR